MSDTYEVPEGMDDRVPTCPYCGGGMDTSEGPERCHFCDDVGAVLFEVVEQPDGTLVYESIHPEGEGIPCLE